ERLGTSPHVQARWGKPLGGEGSQKPAKEPETHPAHTAWSSTRRPSYTTVTQSLHLAAFQMFMENQISRTMWLSADYILHVYDGHVNECVVILICQSSKGKCRGGHLEKREHWC
ncbi:mCG13361, partial [Mus musculus]